MKPGRALVPPDLAKQYQADTRQEGGNLATLGVPGAYQPMVSFDKNDLDEIARNTEVWLNGDLNSVDLYIKTKALAIWQMLGEIATKEVKGRNGINAKISAARGWFDMAKRMKEIVAEQANTNPKKP